MYWEVEGGRGRRLCSIMLFYFAVFNGAAAKKTSRPLWASLCAYGRVDRQPSLLYSTVCVCVSLGLSSPSLSSAPVSSRDCRAVAYSTWSSWSISRPQKRILTYSTVQYSTLLLASVWWSRVYCQSDCACLLHRVCPRCRLVGCRLLGCRLTWLARSPATV
jgi:hypothetical protein